MWQIRAVNGGIRNVSNFQINFNQLYGCQGVLALSMGMELEHIVYLHNNFQSFHGRDIFCRKLQQYHAFFKIYSIYHADWVSLDAFPFSYAPQDALWLLSIRHQTLELLSGCLRIVTKRLEIWYTVHVFSNKIVWNLSLEKILLQKTNATKNISCE